MNWSKLMNAGIEIILMIMVVFIIVILIGLVFITIQVIAGP